MGNKKDKDLKAIKIRERVFRIITETPKDLNALRFFALKNHIVDSGHKFDVAIETLKASGRIYIKAGKVAINQPYLKMATFIARGKGGYLLIDGDSRQYLVSEKFTEGYKSNDRVNVSFSYDVDRSFPFIVSKQTGEEEKSSMPLITPPKTVLGRVLKSSHDNLVFIPNDKKYTKNITILNQKSTLSKFQDKICVLTIIDDESAGQCASGIITEIKGDAGNPIHEYDAIAESHGANMSWSDEKVAPEIEAIPSDVDIDIELKKDHIVDLRHLNFTTVDPATCKDMDDAIYSTFDEYGRPVIYTAVANVTKYVSLNSEIGKRYIQAGFTTYAPNKAYNILPPELSTGICSLNPNVPRLAFVVKTVLDEKTGNPISSEFFDAIIESKEKFSYERAQEICDEKDDSYSKLKGQVLTGGNLSIEEQVILNSKVADILWKGFAKREMLRFETKNEYEVKFNEDFSDIVDIFAQPHIPYHKVIEAFMLTANEATALFAKEHNIPNIYRVHAQPNEDKLDQAYEFFGYLGIDFDGDLSPQGLKDLISSVKGTYKEKIVNNFLIRMQSKAKYSITTNPEDVEVVGTREYKNRAKSKSKPHLDGYEEEEISHFGLQSKQYSHTTSPIRRITDYVTHFNILAIIHGRKPLEERKVLEIAQWANQMQDQVDLSDREFAELNSAIYCESHIGDIMQGKIVGFKKGIEGMDSSIDDYLVLVENEDMGIKVQIPASEMISTDIKNITMSQFGSALITKSGSKPVLRLCDNVIFKISEASRMTRTVLATTKLEAQKDKSDSPFAEYIVTEAKKPRVCAKRQRMRNNVIFNKTFSNSPEAREEIFEQHGKKHTVALTAKTGVEVAGQEAYENNKRGRKKRDKQKEKELESSQDYQINPDEIENS